MYANAAPFCMSAIGFCRCVGCTCMRVGDASKYARRFCREASDSRPDAIYI